MDRLQERFARAGIELRLAASPRAFNRRLLTQRAETLFMIDVRHKRGRSRPHEYILLHRGALVDVRILDVSKTFQQVLLAVEEPATRLRVREYDRRTGRRVVREHLVPATSRRLLVGMDESHLFVCPLARKASSVREAHAKLVPPAVHITQHHKCKRQGEWFFVPVEAPETLEKITNEIALVGVRKRQRLGEGGHPHVADELVPLQESLFVRGRVRHAEHRVLKLNRWHEVHRNTEERQQVIPGMTWVD